VLLKILWCSIYLRPFPKPMPLPNSNNTPSLTLLTIAFCLPLRHFCPTPPFILPIDVSHKYTDGLMRRCHCNKLIGHKQMFHLGIAHNRRCWRLPDYTSKKKTCPGSTIKMSLLQFVSSSLALRQNKLKCLSPVSFKPSLIFACKASLPLGTPLR